MTTVHYMKINRGTIIASQAVTNGFLLPRMDEVIVLNNKGYLVRGIHHYPMEEVPSIYLLLDEYPYTLNTKSK